MITNTTAWIKIMNFDSENNLITLVEHRFLRVNQTGPFTINAELTICNNRKFRNFALVNVETNEVLATVEIGRTGSGIINFQGELEAGTLLGFRIEGNLCIEAIKLEGNIVVTSNTNEEIFIDVPSDQFPTIQSAINYVKCNQLTNVTIKIACGIYTEALELNGLDAGAGYRIRDQLNEITNDYPGLKIIGDDRRFIGFTYVNDYRWGGNSGRQLNYTLTTNIPGVGPFTALIAGTFGAITSVINTPAQISGATGTNAFFGVTPPALPDFNGNVAVIARGGGISFVTKALNAQNAGAGAVIITNTNPGAGPVTLGGFDPSITIPVFSLSLEEGNLLRAAIDANPGLLVTITSNIPGAPYYPSLGTNFGVVQLTQPAANQIRVSILGGDLLPVADDNIGTTPVLAQPSFNSGFGEFGTEGGGVAIGPGDRVVVVGTDYVSIPEVLTITAVNDNTITVTPNPTIDLTIPGAAITFLPCVIVQPDPDSVNIGKKAPVYINNCGVAFQGIAFRQNPTLDENDEPLIPFAAVTDSIYAQDSMLLLGNCAIFDEVDTTANGHGVDAQNTAVNLIKANFGDVQDLPIIGWANGIQLVLGSSLNGNTVNTSDTSQDGFDLFDSAATLNNLQVMNANAIAALQGAGILVNNSQLVINKLLNVNRTIEHGIQVTTNGKVSCLTPSVSIERNEVINPSFDNVAGLRLDEGTDFTIGKGTFFNASLPSNVPIPFNPPTLHAVFAHNTGAAAIPGFTPVIAPALSVATGAEFNSSARIHFFDNDENIRQEGNGEVYIVQQSGVPIHV
jgi:hypothetical protein